MILKQTRIAGLWEVWPEFHRDERGFFARTSCLDEFTTAGLPADWSQCSVSWNEKAYTLRGMHYQAEPHGEHKLVRCVRGRIFDVAVDIRPESPTFRQWLGLELTADNHAALYIPPGLAHGFLTMENETEVFYQIRERHVPEAARGVRWNDPAFAVAWPAVPETISERDAGYALFMQAR